MQFTGISTCIVISTGPSMGGKLMWKSSLIITMFNKTDRLRLLHYIHMHKCESNTNTTYIVFSIVTRLVFCVATTEINSL